MKLRLLPLTMFAALMLLAVKLADLVRGGQEFSRTFLIGSVEAQQPKPQDAASAAAPTPPAAPAASSSSSGAPAPAASSSGSSGAPDAAKPAPAEAASTPSPQSDSGDEGGHGLAPGARVFSPTELELLQNLGKRRDQLEGWQKDLEIKENLLSATETRIDDKLAQVDTMKKELQEMIALYTGAEDAKIKSLVKIYEDMKPREAARIFDQLEMPVLLMVIDRMAEKKAAPVLAEMDPKKAKQVTVELAEARRLQNTRLNAAKATAAAKPAATPAPAAPAAATR